jgi:hypothetical protein
MTAAPPRPLTRNRLLVSVLINQLATPGLGSLIARRFISGAGQLLLALAGFGMTVVWMVQFFWTVVQQRLGEPITHPPRGWLTTWGSILFGASWLWALVTSVGLWRQMKAAQDGTGPDSPM